MLILASDGLTSENVIKEFGKLLNKTDMRAALITTASEEYKEKSDSVPRMKSLYESFGVQMDCIDIDFDDIRRLYDYDIIEIMGGNPCYLLNSMNRCEAKPVLLELLKLGKIIIGWSAGAMVFQKDITVAVRLIPEDNIKVGLKDFTALGIIDYEILPHYEWLLSDYPQVEAISEEREALGFKNYRLLDGDALFSDEQGIRWIKKNKGIDKV